MSVVNTLSRAGHLSEFNSPLDTAEGVLTPAQRRARAMGNLGGGNLQLGSLSLGPTATTDALVFGAGSAATPASLGSTAGIAVHLRFNATHTSGDMRAIYARLHFSGIGGSGEALRAFAIINGVSVATGGTVNGAHISIGTVGAAAAVSGAANALRVTFGIAAASTTLGGTCAVMQVDTDIDSAVTLPSNMAFMRFTNTGSKSLLYLMNVPTVASAAMFAAHVTQVMSHSIAIKSAAGTTYYIMCTDTATNRTGGAI